MKRKWSRLRILSSDSEDGEEDGSSLSCSDSDTESHEDDDRRRHRIPKSFKIPRRETGSPWTAAELENFRKNWPHLKNFSDSVLKNATLAELTGLARQKFSGTKLLSQILSANYEQVASFPEKVEGGEDWCTGKAHPTRFLRGYVGDSQELWKQAREEWGVEGIDPISNYEVVSIGLGDLLTPTVWNEVHKPNSRKLTVRMLSTKSVEEAWKAGDKSDSPKEFESLQELKMALATLDGVYQKVMPWNMAFKTLHTFLISINFGESDLSQKSGKLSVLANFVDEILRGNARNWEEKKNFFSYQDLAVRWTTGLARRLSVPGPNTDLNGKRGAGNKKKLGGSERGQPRIPGWVCRRYNEGRCDSKDDRHQSPWDASFVLKHLCSKWQKERNRCCLEPHPEIEHK
jgi:hypothetical protein